MPDKPLPLFPTQQTADTFRETMNVQKQLLDTLVSQKKEYEQIGRINLDIEKRVTQRRQNERRLLDLIKTKVLEREGLIEKKIAANSDKDLRAANRLLKSNARAISDTKQLLTLSQQANSVEIEVAKRKYEEDQKYFNFASNQMKNLFGIKLKEYDLTKGIGEELIKIGVKGEMIAYTWGAILMMFKGAFDLFNQFDKSAQSFRMTLGLTRAESAVIRKDAERIAIDYMAMGVSIEGVYKSYQALGNIVGGVHNVTKDTAEEVSLMASQFGISEERSAGFLRNMAVISGHSIETQTSMLAVAQSMSSAAGVPLDEVMKGVATKSANTLLMMSRIPNVVLRAALELKRMGTSMDMAASAGSHVLDFSQSINEEMEASVLLGRSINMQRIRQLAYSRDLEGAAKATVELAKQQGFATRMDYFQMKAFAQMTGYSVDQLLSMVQASTQLDKIRLGGTDAQKEQLKLIERMRKENDAALKARAKDVDFQIRQMGNQARLVQIQNKWNALMAKAQEFLLPIVDNLLKGVLALTDWIPQIMAFIPAIGKVFTFLSKIEIVVDKIGFSLLKWGLYGFKSLSFGQKLLGIFGKIPIIGKSVTGVIMMIAKAFGFAGKFLGFFGKFLGPIGWVITAFQAISGFIKGWNSTTGSWVDKLKGGVIGALRNIIPGFDWIVKTIKGIWGWIVKIVEFSFKWLSPLGLIIQGFQMIWPTIREVFTNAWSFVKNFFGSIFGGEGIGGIKQKFVDTIKTWAGAIDSFGSYVVKAITFAFNKAFAWVTDKFAGVMKFFGKIFGGGGVESKATAAYIPAATITPTGTTVNPLKKEGAMPSKSVASESEPMSEETGKRMVALLEKIASKDTHINLDGSLVSTQLSRGIEFRGNYGVNK